MWGLRFKDSTNLEAFPKSFPKENHSFRDYKDVSVLLRVGDSGDASTVAVFKRDVAMTAWLQSWVAPQCTGRIQVIAGFVELIKYKDPL